MATSKIFSVLFFVVGLVVLKPGAGETLKLHFQVNIVKRLGLGLGMGMGIGVGIEMGMVIGNGNGNDINKYK